ncbi:hypothetical protein SAMN05660909_01114 [Chitinophaga terrae (ex Kim and Jung 2007)]|uniref:Uncharacterized protein n=1 Tax=Chitinophaga terrae (ex Kim and Jung 2007) TaxID=408074 RepID=A0A1H3Z9S9_9BACT|nr:hypothetical protein [Chitinophaga terrae (ex Kim and Jung 2007)]GEP88644.1 hypothetical protein CTE07_02890 [Chitinophaga terrae (ex Kim and Jung 2007)]SEA20509.1 hypothetical protein SAMN05660909_01114 [Chitinophaga terrae (ex Kim and Jung 2007)]
MVKRILLSLFLLVNSLYTFAQLPDAAGLKQLRKMQDSLQYLSQEIFSGKGNDGRLQATDDFIPLLVRALKVKHSFRFPFDSLKTVSILYPQDSAFRIFTWALEKENGFYRHYGAIQMKTPDGQLKLFPLFDASDFMTNTDTVTDNKSWYGCLYYNIIHKRYFNQDYYTLFGWDANNPRSQKKIAEMLTFKNGAPVFGGPFFSFVEDSVRKPTQNRFIIEYKKESTATLNYNKELNMIVYDHLISETNEPMKKFTYVSDMDYEGYKWQAGKWVHVNKIFNDAIPLGKGAPVPQPLIQKKKSMTNPKSVDDYQAEEGSNPGKKPAKKQR